MNDLVINHNNTLVTTQNKVSILTNNNEQSIQRLIRTYKSDLEEFGKLEFQDELICNSKNKINYKKVYYLNEQQATLLLTYMKNTLKVREAKKLLVKAFYDMKEKIKLLELKNNNKLITKLERRNAFTILGYKSQLAQQKERNNLVVKALECELALKNKELEQKQNINYDNPSPELKKALAERGKILMGKNDFNDLGEHLATKICISLREILGTNYPPCFKQLIDIVFMESRNYFTRKTHIYQNKPYTLESFKIKRADNSYSPIYGKWVIEDGKQIKGWELELKWKDDKMLKNI